MSESLGHKVINGTIWATVDRIGTMAVVLIRNEYSHTILDWGFTMFFMHQRYSECPERRFVKNNKYKYNTRHAKDD